MRSHWQWLWTADASCAPEIHPSHLWWPVQDCSTLSTGWVVMVESLSNGQPECPKLYPVTPTGCHSQLEFSSVPQVAASCKQRTLLNHFLLLKKIWPSLLFSQEPPLLSSCTWKVGEAWPAVPWWYYCLPKAALLNSLCSLFPLYSPVLTYGQLLYRSPWRSVQWPAAQRPRYLMSAHQKQTGDSWWCWSRTAGGGYRGSEVQEDISKGSSYITGRYSTC